MHNLALIDKVCIGLAVSGGLGTAIWLGLVWYLKHKWLLLLEDILDDGVRFYSINMQFAGQGVLQYGTVFLCSWHAKRFGMLEKRSEVPKHIQRVFVFAFFWFMLSAALMFTAAYLHHAYLI